MKTPIIRTAEKVPEDLYSFKPTPEVRSLGQLIGHIADANFNIRGASGGEKPPANGGIEKNTTGKAAMQKAPPIRSRSARRCWRSTNRMTTSTKGNLVTYMRLKGIVPP